MKYLFTLILAILTLLVTSVANNPSDEECYTIAVHQMLNGDYVSAIENFEMVLTANPTHCEALNYAAECYLALLLLAECKEDVVAFAAKTIEYANKSIGDFSTEGKAVYYNILAKNQAALWGCFYDDFSNAEYEVYKHFENNGSDELGWYALGDYYLTCSYYPSRQFLKSYNSETITSSLFEVSSDCYIEDAKYAFEKCIEYSKRGVLGNYGLMEIALFDKDMDTFREYYTSILHKNYAPPLQSTIQYFATLLYDDCLIDDFYDQLDIEIEEGNYENGLIGSIIDN